MTAFEKATLALTAEAPTDERLSALTPAQEQALEQACTSIAPSWPLDRLIAVNPLWAMREQSIETVSARLSALAYIHNLMPPSHFLRRWQSGQITDQHLSQAAGELGYEGGHKNLLRVVRELSRLPHWHNISDLVDAGRDRQHKMAWRDEIIHQISQFCAAYFQPDGPLNAERLSRGQATETPLSLYQHWLRTTLMDRGIAILMDEPGLEHFFKTLPKTDDALFDAAIDELGIDDGQLEDYAQALLLDINGWAAWVAYEDWQRNLEAPEASSAPATRSLLAIRLAWELALWRYLHQSQPEQAQNLNWLWHRELDSLPSLIKRHIQAQRPLWVWQRASELAYQQPLQEALTRSIQAPPEETATPDLQAVFCIDVRSEPMRRALEQQSQSIQTIGFAGFFGLPLSFVAPGSALAQPHLPGLLSPKIELVNESEQEGQQAARQLNWKARLQEWSQTAASTFTAVEAGGLLYAGKLLRRSLASKAPDSACSLGNTIWRWRDSKAPLTLADRVPLARGVLTAMGLTRGFAPRILLVGHGSHSSNNPHAAGLECGACGGQSGEVSARALARLLNDDQVRAELAREGIEIPEQTCFIPALHHTITDRIEILENRESVGATEQAWIARAEARTRSERAESLGLEPGSPDLEKRLENRQGDWSQTRPEWGLANNAAFIAAPRALTRSIDLQGRCFLHDYDASLDGEFERLELIMTAPMVVAHWINMQYNCSTLDNRKFGSGNKVLHNVVGGHIGVFEGNGGDLRIGLPRQSLHNGERWMHEPLRLSVYLAAPTEAIERIIGRHEMLQALVNNGWLHLFQVDERTGDIKAFRAV